MQLIDSHCHYDAPEFDHHGATIMQLASQQGVAGFVIPAVTRSNWRSVKQLADQVPGAVYALGIHPCWIDRYQEGDLSALRHAVRESMSDPRFIGVGEIGLDFFVPGLDRQLQWLLYMEQLKIACDFELPVIIHVRRSQDMILKGLRQTKVSGGIAHAFNGSDPQAERFVAMNFCLGFGGAMTFTRALQIRRLARQLPATALVLETDAPDIAPAWLHPGVNDSRHLPRIAATLAELRQESVETIAAETTKNVLRVLPRMRLTA